MPNWLILSLFIAGCLCVGPVVIYVDARRRGDYRASAQWVEAWKTQGWYLAYTAALGATGVFLAWLAG